MTEWILKIIAFFKGNGKNEFREDFKTAMIGYRRVNKSLVDHLELIEDKLKEGEKKGHDIENVMEENEHLLYQVAQLLQEKRELESQLNFYMKLKINGNGKH